MKPTSSYREEAVAREACERLGLVLLRLHPFTSALWRYVTARDTFGQEKTVQIPLR